MRRIGFLVNPIAGMGGRVGLKGTDGEQILASALELGATPLSPEKSIRALSYLKDNVFFLTCSGQMGEEELLSCKYSNYRIVYKAEGETTAKDTKQACRKFLESDVDIIFFCGGDGTARDILEVVDQKVPILGIPSGVKMHSAVFAVTPEKAGEVAQRFLKGHLPTREAEVLDIDEEKYRRGILDIKLLGYALTLYEPSLIQTRKSFFEAPLEEESKEAIAKFVLEEMKENILYILGPGTTTKEIAKQLGIEKTLLGVDLVFNNKIVKRDANETDILENLRGRRKAKIIISPLGSQGFIFGRGNQQISSKVIKRVGLKNIILVATHYKLSKTPILRVDTGDEKLDSELRDFRRVISGYHEMVMKKVE